MRYLVSFVNFEENLYRVSIVIKLKVEYKFILQNVSRFAINKKLDTGILVLRKMNVTTVLSR